MPTIIRFLVGHFTLESVWLLGSGLSIGKSSGIAADLVQSVSGSVQLRLV